MVEGNHWDQWFSDGFQVRQPLVTMVFNGCAPLVQWWNGYVPSLKSSLNLRLFCLRSSFSTWAILPVERMGDTTFSVQALCLNNMMVINCAIWLDEVFSSTISSDMPESLGFCSSLNVELWGAATELMRWPRPRCWNTSTTSIFHQSLFVQGLCVY